MDAFHICTANALGILGLLPLSGCDRSPQPLPKAASAPAIRPAVAVSSQPAAVSQPVEAFETAMRRAADAISGAVFNQPAPYGIAVDNIETFREEARGYLTALREAKPIALGRDFYTRNISRSMAGALPREHLQRWLRSAMAACRDAEAFYALAISVRPGWGDVELEVPEAIYNLTDDPMLRSESNLWFIRVATERYNSERRIYGDGGQIETIQTWSW